MLTNILGRISSIHSHKCLQNVNSKIKCKNIFAENRKTFSFIREISNETKLKDTKNFVPFAEMLNWRRSEAQRSIIVQVQSAQSFNELYSYCNLFGAVKQMYHYTSSSEQLHFIIVEFTNELHAKNVLVNSSHMNNVEGYPVCSNFLWFKASNRKSSKLKQLKNIKLNAVDGNTVPKEDDINIMLHSCKDVSDQMVTLHNVTMLNEVATRLRFLTTRQIELAISGMFPNAIAYPFGSSVNGFGKMGCDVDIVLRLTTENMIKEDKRLVFHCKAVNGYERSITQKHMEIVGDILQLFLPGCTQVRKILQARVPIIKYYQQLTDVECDLSMSNMSGVWMSDLLYLFGSIDPRVCPLVFTIRKWAKEVGLTSNSPGRWITNFSLTLLVIAFLQHPSISPSILPALNMLVQHADENDKYITEDGVNCTFLRDLNKLNYKSNNTDNLESLLKQFYEFYSIFDFSSNAITLNEATFITKPEHSPLYIVNPLERGLNVSKNVSLEELEKFKYELRNAAWALESQENDSSKWGILEIFNNKRKTFSSSSAVPLKQGRLMDISRIFEEQENACKCFDANVEGQRIGTEILEVKENMETNTRNMPNYIKRQKSKR